MSGAHCIDFYNKSTLTFIVIYLCFSSCFLLHCHLLKPSAESFTIPVCICSFRVLLRQVHTRQPAGRAAGTGGGSGAQTALDEAAAVWALFSLCRLCLWAGTAGKGPRQLLNWQPGLRCSVAFSSCQGASLPCGDTGANCESPPFLLQQ